MSTMELAFMKAQTKNFGEVIKKSYVWNDFIKSTKESSEQIAKSLKSVSGGIK